MAETFDLEAASPSGVGTNVKLIEDTAATVRRMKANEDYDAKGFRTIWHRGRRTELLSWEDRAGAIVKQELSFYGMVVEYRQGSGLRTGEVPMAAQDDTSGSGQMAASLVRLHPELDTLCLDYASTLLKGVPGRDFYAQHLLKHVNDAIAELGFDDARTAVSKLDGFSKSRQGLARLTEATKTSVSEPPPKSRLPVILAVLAALGIVLGLLVGRFLVR